MEQDTKLWHRKQCSGRILIGPWEFKAPQQQTPWTTSPEQLDQSSIDESTRTIKSNKRNYGSIARASSGQTSFVTAETGAQSTVYNSALSSPMNTSHDDDEIDFDLLGRVHSTKSDDSIDTIRAPKQIKPQVARKIHRPHKPLKWKKSGSVFVSSAPDHPAEPTVLAKREPMLYMRTVSGKFGSEPTRYKAATEARYNLLTEKWKQVEIVLTPLHLSLYSFSTFLWPKQKLEHRVTLTGLSTPEKLSLSLLSPLDYTFCLRYLSRAGRVPMMHTLTFKARSYLQCQQWYMALYGLLPDHAKQPVPNWCEVYVPILDLCVHLPLYHQNSDTPRYDVTLEDVKDAVIEILDEDPCLEFEEKVGDAELGLCWTFQERAEWVYWQRDAYDAQTRIDMPICPQSIEQTHRLELRPIEHTPHDVLLKENLLLQEPPPIEGQLCRISDTFGPSFHRFQKTCYAATFDHYLFYIQPSKVHEPNSGCMSSQGEYITRLDPFLFHDATIRHVEYQRRMRLMMAASGVIDLTEVSFVRRSFADTADDQSSMDSHIPIMTEPLRPTRSNQKPHLEIIMENGLQLKFGAYSGQTCDLWVKYLSDIIVYWKARKEAERDVHIKPKKEESCIYKKKYQVDTRIWSYCLYEQCRDVVKSGILYYQPRNRGSYSQKNFILTANGWLLFYDVYNRRSSKPTVCREGKGLIDIAGSFVYSGVEFTKKKKGASKSEKKVARIYENGLSTNDEKLVCLFSIWRPKQRRYFSSVRKQLRVYTNDKQLNPKGDTWLFLAHSREEKEEWVWALNTVTEHLIRNEQR